MTSFDLLIQPTFPLYITPHPTHLQKRGQTISGLGYGPSFIPLFLQHFWAYPNIQTTRPRMRPLEWVDSLVKLRVSLSWSFWGQEVTTPHGQEFWNGKNTSPSEQ